jgi:hypothetical protein
MSRGSGCLPALELQRKRLVATQLQSSAIGPVADGTAPHSAKEIVRICVTAISPGRQKKPFVPLGILLAGRALQGWVAVQCKRKSPGPTVGGKRKRQRANMVIPPGRYVQELTRIDGAFDH